MRFFQWNLKNREEKVASKAQGGMFHLLDEVNGVANLLSLLFLGRFLERKSRWGSDFILGNCLGGCWSIDGTWDFFLSFFSWRSDKFPYWLLRSAAFLAMDFGKLSLRCFGLLAKKIAPSSSQSLSANHKKSKCFSENEIYFFFIRSQSTCFLVLQR